MIVIISVCTWRNGKDINVSICLATPCNNWHANIRPNTTPKQHNKTDQPKADKYPAFNFSSFNCGLSVVLQHEKGAYHKNSHVVFCYNK